MASTEVDSSVETEREVELQADSIVWILECRCTEENFLRQRSLLPRPWSTSWYCPDDRRYLSPRIVLWFAGCLYPDLSSVKYRMAAQHAARVFCHPRARFVAAAYNVRARQVFDLFQRLGPGAPVCRWCMGLAERTCDGVPSWTCCIPLCAHCWALFSTCPACSVWCGVPHVESQTWVAREADAAATMAPESLALGSALGPTFMRTRWWRQIELAWLSERKTYTIWPDWRCLTWPNLCYSPSHLRGDGYVFGYEWELDSDDSIWCG